MSKAHLDRTSTGKFFARDAILEPIALFDCPDRRNIFVRKTLSELFWTPGPEREAEEKRSGTRADGTDLRGEVLSA